MTVTRLITAETGLALPEGGDFSSRWSSISAGENSGFSPLKTENRAGFAL